MTDAEMQIRAFAPADEVAVIALWDQVQLTRPWNDAHKDVMRKLQQMQHTHSSIFWVAEAGGEIVATVMAGYDGHRASVNYLAVHPDWQKRGIGKSLMQEVEKWCLSLGCPKINLMVRTDNQSVLQFYTQLDYRMDDVVVLSKRLIEDQ